MTEDDADADAERDARSAAADEGLRAAMATNEYDALAKALELHCSVASEATLAEARAQRDRLNKKRKKESQRLRKAHAEAMEAHAEATEAVGAEAAEDAPVFRSLASPPAPKAAAAAPVGAVALPLDELSAATCDFGDAKLIGSGGYGQVFLAEKLPSLPASAVPENVRHLPFAVKRAKAGAHLLSDLKREVSVLRECHHPHVLPLLGYYLEGDSPCLVFPLMRGGSFADRLFPKEADPEHLLRLGISSEVKPLRWRERLRILKQATEALLYLHTPVSGSGKGIVVHRDFKPENILLDDSLNAYLADTGFAKMERGADQAAASRKKSASNALYLTHGYLDPSIGLGGDYSATTDGFALGITMLVVLTGRSPLNIINTCEEEFDLDFEDIDAAKIADPAAFWPVRVASAVKELVRCAGVTCLCHQSQRKRLAISGALTALSSLGEDVSAAEEAAAQGDDAPKAEAAAASSGSSYEPTPLSMQVRNLRKGGEDEHEGVKANVLLAFGALIGRLDAVYAARAADAPEDFMPRIDFWQRECGMNNNLRTQLHGVRIWANAARHQNDERWRKEGPRDEEEASRRLQAVERAIAAMEKKKEAEAQRGAGKSA